jgi:hypothetical protein
MSAETPASPEGSNLEIDLTLSFQPAWVKEAAAPEKLARLADRFGDASDSRGGRRDDRRGPRQDRRPPRDGEQRGPRRDGDRGQRRDSRDKRDGGRKGDRRDDRRGPRQEEPRPDPVLTGWDLAITSHGKGVDGLARQIKTSAVAYPLFDLAQLVLEKSERYTVTLKRKDGPALFQLTTDGSVWLSEREALAAVLSKHLDTYYKRETVTVEPPKGSYSVVAVCGLSDTLIGPPNYHDYQDRLRKLHAERYANMPFEAYKSRVRMVRDEEMIQKWKDERSKKEEFVPISKADAEKPASKPVNKQPEIEQAAPAPQDEQATPAPETEQPPASPEAEQPVAAPEGEQPEAAPAPEGEPPVEAPQGEQPVRLGTLAEVERHFREHHAAKVIVQAGDKIVIPGPAILHSSTPTALTLARRTVDELRRFPLPMAHNLGQALVARGLHIFKAHENITYVSIARPRYLDRATTPISDALSGILTYLEEHPKTPANERRKALAAQRPLPEGDNGEAERDAALTRDLSWLLHEGYVVDYVRLGLEAVRRPKSRQEQPQ